MEKRAHSESRMHLSVTVSGKCFTSLECASLARPTLCEFREANRCPPGMILINYIHYLSPIKLTNLRLDETADFLGVLLPIVLRHRHQFVPVHRQTVQINRACKPFAFKQCAAHVGLYSKKLCFQTEQKLR